jgi:hypothetical protein
MQKHVIGAGLALLLFTSPVFAQGMFGIGGRMSMVRGDVAADPAASAEMFLGGQLRARISPRTSVELSLDRRVQNVDPTQRVRDYPLQGSLLLFPIHSTLSPYVLGGVGWYTHAVDSLAAGQVIGTTSSRKMGYHAGFGGELKLGRHAGVHADYRYTFVHFGDSNPLAPPSAAGSSGVTGALASRFLPSYDGSMWTAGLTFYF